MTGAITPAHAIVVDRLSKRFDAVTAVDDVSFAVPVGSTTALLGGNGAGKTTTLSILLGLLTPTSGAVTVLGADMLRDRYRVLGEMNFSSPYVDLPRRLTAFENLTVYARLYGVRASGRRIGELARDLDLEAFLKRPTGSLSAGQRTRVSLAKALLNRPRLLLLDEPTASLDPDTARDLRARIRELAAREARGVLWTSHNMHEVEQVCDRVLFLSRGRILLAGDPRTLPAEHGRA